MTRHTKKLRPGRDTTQPSLYFWKNSESAPTKGSWHTPAAKQGSRTPLESRAGHLKGVCAPNSSYHGLTLKRANAEDHQVNEQLLATCCTPPSESNFIQGSNVPHFRALAHEKYIEPHFRGSQLRGPVKQAPTSFAFYASLPLAQTMSMVDGVLVTITEPHR